MNTKVSGRILAACVVMSSIFGCATGDRQGTGGGMGSGKHENQYCSWEFDYKTNTLNVIQKADAKCQVFQGFQPKGDLYFGERGEQTKLLRFHTVAEFETKDLAFGTCCYWYVDGQGHLHKVCYPC